MKKIACLNIALFAALGCAHAASSFRLYDFTPASQEDNPIVARIEGTPLEIPLSELETYLEHDLPLETYQSLTSGEKRQRLPGLIDEYLLLWDAERRSAHRDEKIESMLENTRRLLMEEQFRADVAEQGEEALAALVDSLFEKATVAVNQESYDLLLEMAKEDDEWAQRYLEYSVDENRRENEAPPPSPQFDPEQLSRVLAVCDEEAEIALGSFMQAYHAMPIYDRPRLGELEGFHGLLKSVLEPYLLFAEAQRRGYRDDPRVEQIYQQNRSALLKMWAYERLWGEAAERMEALEAGEDYEQRLMDFHKKHLEELYSWEEDGLRHYHRYEAIADRVPQDYYDHLVEVAVAEHLESLRGEFEIWVNEGFFEEKGSD